jgi:Domain of unknown function (DUF4129)
MPAPKSSDRVTLFQIVEEATDLLRHSSISTWLSFYLGTAPFVVYLFFFWSDMSRSASAREHLFESSLILALLYWWMKVWQAVYAERLMNHVEGREDLKPMRKRGWLRLVASQGWIHMTMPVMLTLSAVATLPLAWTYAFYHNVTVMAADHYREGGKTKALLGKALAQSQFMALQNHAMLSLITLLALLIYLNVFAGFFLFNTLLKSFTGSENEFTRSAMLYMSSPVQLLLLSVCYLIMAPLLKALYVLRCFYGEARRSGADLEVTLRSLAARQAPVAGLVVLCLCLLSVSQLQAEEAPSSKATADQLRQGMMMGKRNTAPPLTVPPTELDSRIKQVLGDSEFQWRFPREAGPKREQSWLGAMVSEFFHWLSDSVLEFARWLGKILDKLFGGTTKEHVMAEPNSAWLAALGPIVYGLIIVIVVLLVVVLVRTWLNNRSLEEPVVTAEAAPEVNLENEDVLATQLPENEWMRLAREKMQAGELRLALRALFLATLAHLGEKRFIAVKRSKSNGDYVREVGFRARDRAELSTSFSEQVRTFDRVWYGWHEVNADMVGRFEQQHELILSHAS